MEASACEESGHDKKVSFDMTPHEITYDKISDGSDDSGNDSDDITPRETSDSEEEWALRGTEREFTIPYSDWSEFRAGIRTTNLATKRMPHLFVRTTTNRIGGGQMPQQLYWDEMGTYWRGGSWSATERLGSLSSKLQQRGTVFECTNTDGHGTVTVYSQGDDEMDGLYWTRQVLGIYANSDYAFSKSNGSVSRCVRQLKFQTLEEMARFFKTDLLATLAYYCRTEIPVLNVKGHISHLFAKELADPKESVYVAPMLRSKLEGVTLIRIGGSDYSLKTGKRVGCDRVGQVYEVVEEGGSLERIDDDALVG